MTKIWFLPALALSSIAAAAIGFGASHVREGRAMDRLKVERDLALDCRHAGKSVAPCPVIYRNTRIVWRDRVETVPTPDRKQTERIAYLSADLARARRTILALEHARTPGRAPRITAGYMMQNGSMEHPYNASTRCPAGSVVLYDAGLSGGSLRRSGDPDVCYVRKSLNNYRTLALSSH